MTSYDSFRIFYSPDEAFSIETCRGLVRRGVDLDDAIVVVIDSLLADPRKRNARMPHARRTIQSLIAVGANVNETGGRFLSSALHLSISCDASIAMMLLRAKCDVNVKNMNGFTVLHAIINAMRDCARLNDTVSYTDLLSLLRFILRERSANLELYDNAISTPLMHAVLLHEVDAVRELIIAGANPDAVDRRYYADSPVLQDIYMAVVHNPVEAHIHNYFCIRTWRFIRYRAFLVCFALQHLQLPALITLHLLDAVFNDHPLYERFVPMHRKWDFIVAIKHADIH